MHTHPGGSITRYAPRPMNRPVAAVLALALLVAVGCADDPAVTSTTTTPATSPPSTIDDELAHYCDVIADTSDEVSSKKTQMEATLDAGTNLPGREDLVPTESLDELAEQMVNQIEERDAWAEQLAALSGDLIQLTEQRRSVAPADLQQPYSDVLAWYEAVAEDDASSFERVYGAYLEANTDLRMHARAECP